MRRAIRHTLFGAAVSAAFLLSACAGTGDTAGTVTKIDQTIASQPVQTGITVVCAVLTGAKVGWDAWAAGHHVSDTNLANADAAYAGAQALCAGDAPQNTADAVAKVVAATVAVLTALHSEQGGIAATASQ